MARSSARGYSVADSLQQEGQQAYKQREYDKAISLFTRAIEKAPSVQLYDSRAACHEKLDDLKSALKDAKKIINGYRNDPTGYLRAGGILIKMEKSSTALEIYAHGLKSVKHVGLGFEKLRKTEQDLMDLLFPPRRRDPFKDLPLELAEMILEYFTFRQVTNICLVSKRWVRLVRSLPRLWRHCDLSDARRKVRGAFISRAINVGRDKLTTVTLNNVYDFDKSLFALVQHCPIQQVTLKNAGLQDENLVTILRRSKTLKTINLLEGTSISTDAVSSLCAALGNQIEGLTCTLIRQRELSLPTIKCSRLRTLSLTVSNKSDHQPLQNFFRCIEENSPALESLTILNSEDTKSGRWNLYRISLDSCPHLQKVDLCVLFVLLEAIRLPPTIRSLSLTCKGIYGVGTGSDPLVITWYLPLLEELTLDFWGFVHVRHFDFMLSETPVQVQLVGSDFSQITSQQDMLNLPNQASFLRKLTLRSTNALTSAVSSLLSHRRVQNLEHLGLPRCCGVDDVQLDAVLSLFPNLKSLDVSETEITGVGLRTIINHGKIETVNVSNCRLLGTDAVVWARSRGMNVEYRMSTAETGGRTVRY